MMTHREAESNKKKETDTESVKRKERGIVILWFINPTPHFYFHVSNT